MKNHNSKKKPSRATLMRFAGISLRSKIDRMYIHLERQHESLLKLLDGISIEQYKLMNENGKLIKVKKKSMPVLESSDTKLKYAMGEKIFIDTLKRIGKPSLTNEIADHVKTTPEIKKIAKNKKGLMRIMYNSAFNLSKNGQIKRVPVGKKAYEYSLIEWNKRNDAQHIHRKSA